MPAGRGGCGSRGRGVPSRERRHTQCRVRETGVKAAKLVVAAIESLGYRRHDDVGVPFDPGRHEAMGTMVTSEVPRGTVVRVVRPGYGDGDSQLRPAGVFVYRATDLKRGGELWIEVTVPPDGPPRPIQVALKQDGVWKPLAFQ